MEVAHLRIEFLPENIPGTTKQKMKLEISGSPVLLAKGIKGAMNTEQDICALMIAGVVSWCQDAGIDCGDLANMVQFYK